MVTDVGGGVCACCRWGDGSGAGWFRHRGWGAVAAAAVGSGTAAGDHSVIFAGPSERITLSHHAEDRALFAQGALKAALWAHGKKPGMYSMTDVLGLSD